MRYTHEHDFDALIDSASAEYNVPVALIKAVIAQESEFNAKAYRDEPRINDASRGLMQLLYQTARDLGYTGAADGLYDPPTNIQLGTKYLSDNIRQAAAKGYGVDSAISAYNGGFSSERPGDGKRTGHTTASPFINDAYVQSVLEKASYFAHNAGVPLAPVVVIARADNPTVPVAPTALVIGVALLFPRALLGDRVVTHSPNR